MTGTVPTLTIVCMVAACLAGFTIPVALFIFFRKKMHADVLPFLVGCGIMLLFALVLEAAVHQVVLGSPTGLTIRSNVWLYALYGGLMAGLFEETGRLVAFKTVLRKHLGQNPNALMYGAGHGGFEAAVVLGVTMINNLALAIMINSGQISAVTGSLSGDALAQVEAGIQALVTMPAGTFLIGILERVFAVTLQIALSVLVWFAAKDRSRLYLYPVAILIHFAVDAVAVVLVQHNVPMLLVEAVVGIMTAAAVAFARKVWGTR